METIRIVAEAAETVRFADFGTIFEAEIVAECTETGHPIVEIDGKLRAIAPIQVQMAEAIDNLRRK